MLLAVERLSMRFGAVAALTEFSLDVARGEVVCLLGPSGSGKSTLLRTIAGIERPSAGRITLDGIEVSGPRTFVEPEDRHVGMVFQDYALFPHLTVAANIAFGAGRERATIAGLFERLGIERLAQNYPHELSGGERQRVALARAMAPKPRLLLMDEPFSSLDAQLRDAVRVHTLQFLREAGMTTVIVTHDPDEALRIADRIALLDGGRLVQVGTPEELYRAPHTLFAARFFGSVAALSGTIVNSQLETPLGNFPAAQLAAGTAAVACIRPQHWTLAAAPTGLAGQVVAAEFCGDGHQIFVRVSCIGEPVALSVRRDSTSAESLAPGATVHLKIRTDQVPVVGAS